MGTVSLKKIRHVALDLDGTLYCGETIFPWTLDFLAGLQKKSIGKTFLTNNSSKSRVDYQRKLKRLGIDADLDEIYTSTLCTIEYLKEKEPSIEKLFVLGTESMQKEVAEAGYQLVNQAAEKPDAVLVGFDTGLVYENLCKAAYWIYQGKPYFATHPDQVCPTDQPTWLADWGAMTACLESSTQISPKAVLGKPSPRMIRGILKKYALQKRELAMVGDRIYTDMAMARKAGVMGILVLSGETQKADLKGMKPGPDLVLKNVAELGRLL